MAASGHRKVVSRRDNRGSRRSWCCSFGIPPESPENLSCARSKTTQKSEILSKSGNSFPSSPLSSRTGLVIVGLIDRRRILSPGRVSPIDSDAAPDPVRDIVPDTSSVNDGGAPLESETFHSTEEKLLTPEGPEIYQAPSLNRSLSTATREQSCSPVFDVRLSLKGKNEGCLVLELDSEVLSANSSVFADLISDCRRNSGGGSAAKLCRIEVPDVENLSVYRETIELMFLEDITRRLLKMGVSRAIDVLEVSAGITFTKGILSCLKYIEAVPWSEDDEEKLKKLFTKFAFNNATAREVLGRLHSLDQVDSQQHLAMQLIWSITSGADASARNELKSLVTGLLSKSSVYEKGAISLNKEDLYVVCQNCLSSLVRLFGETSDSAREKSGKEENGKPLIEQISRQVDNLNWLLEILLERQMAEDFVDMWADQGDLLRIHELVSPMIRYELSRVSAYIFIALGRGKLHCRLEARSQVLQAWFGPMLVDFGWLQRCRKGLEIKTLEEAMGQALLTLPLKQQHWLFMEWFRCFSRNGTECPNLGKAFQIWWRRCFLRAPEIRTVESR
ncbi:PREDICTED: BTB/POZ domain-containing protein At2g13690-like [Nelumbo nucifera]|uniref:BTB/POZ domain-containing protein At2g13690-like n=1 Tax=Nelumbo nucifera TaxID=4432 RepID=A0A1U8A2M9_NELNU|nr:PREDICTED: BTB/POZ domain-containing protein At2g13690-like [Nelumbo nucifera]